MSFLGTLGRLTATRKKVAIVKELGVGLAAGAMIGMGVFTSPEWALWVVLVYFTLVQGLAMIENDIFCDFRDFRRLGFRVAGIRFRVAYIVHYVTRDMYIANGTAIVVAFSIILMVHRGWYALFLLVLIIANLTLIPSHVYLAYRISDRPKAIYMGAMLIAELALAVPLTFGFRLGPNQPPVMPVLCIAITLLHIIIIDRIAERLRGSVLEFGGRRWFAWLPPRAPHLFKDLLLFHAMAIQSLVVEILLFATLMIGTSRRSASILGIVALGLTNIFLTRQHGTYRLISEDHQFDERKLPLDRMQLRRSKLLTMSLSVPMVLTILLIIAAVFDDLHWSQIAMSALVLATILVIESPLPFHPIGAFRWLRWGSTLALMGIYTIVYFFQQSALLVLIGCAVSMACYLPTLIFTYFPPRGTVLQHRKRHS